MKKLAMTLLVPALAGCLGSAPKPPVNWTFEIDAAEKVASVVVCAPYGGQRFAVLRADGSIAFDPCNSFAASPAAIIKDAVVARRAEGALVVRRLALDCRAVGRRDAVVELEVVRGETTSRGSFAAPTADGNYTAAFSLAFKKAYEQAHEGLKAAR